MKLAPSHANCPSRTKPTKAQRCASQQNWLANDAVGHFRQIGTLPTLMGCPLHSESRHAHVCLDMSASCYEHTIASRSKAS
jgi:hypothetical protein